MKLSNIQFKLVTSHYYVSMDLQCFKGFHIFVLNTITGKMVEKYFKPVNDILRLPEEDFVVK